MKIQTIEDGFEYQVKQVFDDLKKDYIEEMEVKKVNEEPTDTFSAWLWNNREELGHQFYERIDSYLGLDEFTEDYNFKS